MKFCNSNTFRSCYLSGESTSHCFLRAFLEFILMQIVTPHILRPRRSFWYVICECTRFCSGCNKVKRSENRHLHRNAQEAMQCKAGNKKLRNVFKAVTTFKILLKFNWAHLTEFLHLDSLCCGEGQLQVLFAIHWIQRVVFKLQREERVDQSTEGHSITPTGWEVLDVYVLRGKGQQTTRLNSLLRILRSIPSFIGH